MGVHGSYSFIDSNKHSAYNYIIIYYNPFIKFYILLTNAK